MKSRYDFPDDINAIEYDGDVIPKTNIDHDYRAEWAAEVADTEERRISSDLGIRAIDGVIFIDFPITTMEAEVFDSEPPTPDWQHDMITQANLGIDQFSFEDYYQGLTAKDYDTWQRVLRNYVKSLKNHAGRIRNIDGQIELDYRVEELYGSKSPQELLQYASQLAEVIDEIGRKGLEDPALEPKMSPIKLKNAPPFEVVHVVRGDDKKLHLHIQETSTAKTA